MDDLHDLDDPDASPQQVTTTLLELVALLGASSDDDRRVAREVAAVLHRGRARFVNRNPDAG